MSARFRLLEKLCGIVSTTLVCAATVTCSRTTADLLYATVPDKLVTLQILGINKVTTTEVGAMGTAGCASLARSAAGIMYTVCGLGIVKPDQPQQLATVDLKTGRATPFGTPVMGLAVMGLEFAPDGTLFAVGDTNKASPTFNSLYTADVKTGTFTRVGSTGAPEFFMDFAFDRNGTLYGATSHTLFTIDPKTGTANKVVDFVGGGLIMGLSFNSNQDRLYASDWKTPVSALYSVDIHTGFLTPMAAIGYPSSHGLVPATP